MSSSPGRAFAPAWFNFDDAPVDGLDGLVSIFTGPGPANYLAPDILAEVGHARSERLPILIGFAVEADSDERVIEYARDKLRSKRVDLVVANHAADSFGRDTNRATLVSPTGADALGELPKTELADRIVDWISARLRGTT